MNETQPTLHLQTLKPSSFVMYLLGLIMLFYSIVLRTEPFSTGHPLLQSLHLTPDDLMVMLANYQLPMIIAFVAAGFLIDMCGPRIWLLLGLVMTIVGNYFFSDAATLDDIIIGRILGGFAHPIIFLAILKLGVNWIPKNHFGVFIGLFFCILLISPPYIQYGLIVLTKTYGWDMVVNGVTFMGVFLFLTLIATCFIKSTAPGFRSMRLSALLSSNKIWLICLISSLGWISNTFMLNWGAVFLNRGLQFIPSLAIDTVAKTFLFFSLGAIFFGAISDATRRPRLAVILGFLFGATAFTTIIAMPHLSQLNIGNLVLLTGFLTGSTVMCYLLAYDFFCSATAASAFGLIAFITTECNTWFAQFCTYLLAPIMKSQASTSLNSYLYILIVVPAALFVGCLFTLLLGKTRPLFTE